MNRVHNPLRRHVLARKHQIRLPLRVAQQCQQRGIGFSAGPAEGKGVSHHIGDQPARVAGLEGFNIGHQQADPRARGH